MLTDVGLTDSEIKKKKCAPTVEMWVLMLLGSGNNEGETKSVLGW